MYLEYYGLQQPPFSITPDPHYVFLSEHHRDALAHLLYGIRQGGGGGFVQLTGEVGTGKTTLSRLLLNQLPENTQAALVLNPRLDPVELLETICEELRLRPGAGAAIANVYTDTRTDTPVDECAIGDATRTVAGTTSQATTPTAAQRKKKGANKASVKAASAKPPSKQSAKFVAKPAAKPTAKALYDQLSAYLLQAYARGERVVVIIDEAQNLSTEALEQVRLLTNLETETQKLLQIILIGQPELREMLMRPELRQLAQRITARYHLRPLEEAGTAAYLRHRLNTAGASRFPFTPDAVQRLHRRSGGVPRLINIVAERALLGGYAHDLLTIDAKTIDRAADEALAPSSTRLSLNRQFFLQAAGLAVVVVGFAALLMYWPTTSPEARDGDVPETTTDFATLASVTTASTSIARPGTQPIDRPTQSPTAIDAAVTNASAKATNASGIEPLLQRIRSDTTSPQGAWSSLLAAWKAPASVRNTSIDACPAQPASGWRCMRSRASLDQLLQWDRSVLLRLRTEPHAAWARLLGIRGGRVRLALIGGMPQTAVFDIDRVALAGVWNGEFLAIWPAPAALETRYGADDPAAVAWVRERLQRDRTDADLPAMDSRAIDSSALDSALRNFQTRYGLPGDGRLRPDTEFALATRGTGPRLTVTATDKSTE
jgi:general secretion pathway protein A